MFQECVSGLGTEVSGVLKEVRARFADSEYLFKSALWCRQVSYSIQRLRGVNRVVVDCHGADRGGASAPSRGRRVRCAKHGLVERCDGASPHSLMLSDQNHASDHPCQIGTDENPRHPSLSALYATHRVPRFSILMVTELPQVAVEDAVTCPG